MKHYSMLIWAKLSIMCRRILNTFQRLFGRSMFLPTLPPENELIDHVRVRCVILFIGENGVLYFYCKIDDSVQILIHTPELERWFIASGFNIQEPLDRDIRKSNDPAPEHVENVPPKFRKSPKP